MCVKLLKDSHQLLEYDCNEPLMDQMSGVSDVFVDYKPNDRGVESFLQEMQHCAKTGQNPNVKVHVEYNSLLNGYKTKKKLIRAMNDINLNEVIKLMALMQCSIDKSLEELAASCINR